MFTRHWLQTSLLFVFSLSLALSACTTAAPTTAPAATEAPTAQLTPIKLALLPVLDALPIYVAQEQDLFTKHGVSVEIIPVGSAPERDQVIAAGQADGMINETLSTMFFNKDKVQVQVVRFARAAAPGSPIFRIIASGESGINSPAGLKSVKIGVSQGTVIEYLTYRLLEKEGFQPEEIVTIAVPKIDVRLALLQSGELKAAMLPDPVASLALKQGAQIAMEDSAYPEYSNSTITFRKAVIDEKPEAVRGFLAAIEEAVTLINDDPQKWIPLLIELKMLPQPIVDSFQVPQFVTAGVPSEAQWNDVLAWGKEMGLLEQDVPYAGSVNPSLLP